MTRIISIFILSLLSQLGISQEVHIEQGSYEDYVKHVDKLKNAHDLVVVNFWATWCAPCVKEMPLLLESREKYKDKDVAFLFVSLDFPKHVESKLIPFTEKNMMSEDVFLIVDELKTDDINSISEQWSGAIPITIFISQKKQEIHEGIFHTTSEISDIINKQLNTKQTK